MKQVLAGMVLLVSLAAAQDLSRSFGIGITLVQPNPSCPVFVGSVGRGTPAALAGIRPGDRVIAVDGQMVARASDAAVRSNQPGNVAIELGRGKRTYKVIVQRESMESLFARQGLKLVGSRLFPLDASEAEVQRAATFDPRRIIGRVFPTHYPADLTLYYAGFEVFLLDNPVEVAVGGIEDGPARRAGVWWGDVIIVVNGMDPKGRSMSELETLFSSRRRAHMRLTVDRVGRLMEFSFKLERAMEVMRQNQRQPFAGRPIPLGIAPEYLHCFGEP